MEDEKVGLKIFTGKKAPEGFIKDVSELCKINVEIIENVLKDYSPDVDTNESQLIKDISKHYDITENSVNAIIRVCTYLFYKLENKTITLNDLENDLRSIDREKVFGTLSIVYKTNGTEFVRKMEKYERIFKDIVHVLPSLTSIEYNSNLRLIVDNNGEEIALVPVAQICIKAKKQSDKGELEKTDSVTFQTTMSGINDLIEGFNQIKKELEMISKHIKR